jgi:hypothetical protein
MGHLESGFSRTLGSWFFPEPHLDHDLDGRSPVTQLRDVPREQFDRSVDTPAVDQRSIAASQVYEHKSHRPSSCGTIRGADD